MTREQAETMPNMRLSGITKNDLLPINERAKVESALAYIPADGGLS